MNDYYSLILHYMKPGTIKKSAWKKTTEFSAGQMFASISIVFSFCLIKNNAYSLQFSASLFYTANLSQAYGTLSV
jgi:hypothetical protein